MAGQGTSPQPENRDTAQEEMPHSSKQDPVANVLEDSRSSDEQDDSESDYDEEEDTT